MQPELGFRKVHVFFIFAQKYTFTFLSVLHVVVVVLVSYDVAASGASSRMIEENRLFTAAQGASEAPTLGDGHGGKEYKKEEGEDQTLKPVLQKGQFEGCILKH